jgi:hypothetical protein
MPGDTAAGDTMRYDLMVQGALLGVVREVLRRTEKSGLPGEHHFFITFRTRHPGVEMPPFVREKYPQEMTVVLQHQFWDLEVRDDRFSVSLSFNQVPARLEVPFAAIKAFFDPSVQFGLQFQAEGETPTELGARPDDADGDGDEDKTPDPEAEAAKPTGEVVELDLFRKK